MIFLKSMGLSMTSNSSDKEKNIVSLFKNSGHSLHYICLLNEPFNVNFSTTDEFLLLSEEQKGVELKNLITSLTKICFNDLWVVFIDDAEFIDASTLSIFSAILQLDLIFFVMAFGYKNSYVLNYEIHRDLVKIAQVICIIFFFLSN